MFYRIATVFLGISILISCKSNNNKSLKKDFGIDSAQVFHFLESGKTDKAFILAEEQLSRLKKADKLKEYVGYNEKLINKFISTNKPSIAFINRFYQNIFSLDKQVLPDTSILRSIINAYYYWSENSLKRPDSPDDSISMFLEKAIGLNHQFPVLANKNERYAYQRLGILYNQWGDLKKALGYYDLQNALIDKTEYNALAKLAGNRSIALKETGLIDSAIKIIEDVLPLPDIKPMRRVILFISLLEAQIQKGLFPAANLNIRAAFNILDTITVTPEVNEIKAFAFKNKGILEKLNKQYTADIQSQLLALKYYTASGRSNGRDLGKIFIELGKGYAGTGNYDSALINYQLAINKVLPQADSVDFNAVPLPSQVYAENTIMEALDAKAGALQVKYTQTHQIKFLETAVRCYEVSFEVERKLMQNFSYDESRLIMLKESRQRSEIAIGLCYRLLQMTKNTGWTEAAFRFAEKSKAFVLLESIKRNIAANSVLQKDTLYQRIQSLQVRLAHMDRQIAEVIGIKKDSLVIELTKQKNVLNNQLLFSNNEFKKSNASYHMIADESDSISFALAGNTLLDKNTTLVEFFAGDSATYIFSFSKKTVPVFIKAGDGLTKNLELFLQFFTDKNKINNEPAAYQAAAYKLYQEAGLAAMERTGITQLLIIPDGRFNFVPFEALITQDEKEKSPKDLAYLLLQKKISYGYSVASLLKQLEIKTASSSGNMIFFAPVFANKERSETPLLNTIDELNAIKNEMPEGKYYLKGDATFSRFKKEMDKARIIHIASHAHANSPGGMPPQIEFFDSTLFLNEIYAMHTNPGLVVLSACETGIGIIDKSEGAMSLARGFYYAGAKNIITSLWSVDDRSTALLFSDFYKGLSGNDYALALYHAKQNYLKNANETTASPYYWAGFIHIGYEKQPPQSNRLIYIIGILTILLFSLFIYRRKK